MGIVDKNVHYVVGQPRGIVVGSDLDRDPVPFGAVVLQITGDGDDGNSAFIDISDKRHVVSSTNVTIDGTDKKYGTGSAWFDNTTAYLRVSDFVTADFWPFGQDYCIECWVQAFGGAWTGWESASGRPIIIGKDNISTSSAAWLFGIIDDGSLTFTYNNGAAVQLETTTKVPTTGWHHIAMSNEGDVIRLFIDGTLELEQAIVGTPNDTSDNINIGRGYTRNIHGWVDDIRLTKGYARYTESFTAPTAAHPGSGSRETIDPDADANWADVELHLDMAGTDGGTTFTDNSDTGHTVTVVGDTHTDNVQAHSGTTSAYFDGTGDYLSTPDGLYLDWNDGDWTVEAYVYASSWTGWEWSGLPNMIGHNSPTSSSSVWTFGPTSTGTLKFRYWVGAERVVESASTLSVDEWHHIAMTYDISEDTITLWIDGDPVAREFRSGTPQASSNALLIGQYNNTNITGWVDDVRISYGTCRYTQPFTPLAGAFPTST